MIHRVCKCTTACCSVLMKVPPLISSTCDQAIEAVVMTDETIKLASEISSIKEKDFSQDVEIQQTSKERADMCREITAAQRRERHFIMFQKREGACILVTRPIITKYL